jgi:RNA polymerase sigma-70 factor (ECF subfamily)
MPLPRKDVSAPLEDRFLIHAAARGDRRAAHALYERYREQVWRVVARLVSEEEERLEVCQETWLKAFSSLGKFREDSKFSTWILRIAMNVAGSRARWFKVRKHISLESAEAAGPVLPTRPATQLVTIEKNRERDALETALGELSRKQRRAIVLRYFEELSFADIAEAMDCRESSVRTHLQRAFKKLERSLGETIEREVERE